MSKLLITDDFLNKKKTMGIVKRPNTIEKKFTWFPMRMSNGKLTIGTYYEMTIFKYGADPRHAFWVQKKYSQKEYFLLKLQGINEVTLN